MDMPRDGTRVMIAILKTFSDHPKSNAPIHKVPRSRTCLSEGLRSGEGVSY